MKGKRDKKDANATHGVQNLTDYLNRVTEITKSSEFDDEKIRHTGI